MKKAFFITLSALAVIIIGMFVAGIIVSKDRFMAHTYVNGVDVSYKEADEAKSLLKFEPGQVVVHGLNGDEAINLADVDYTATLSKSVESLIKEQNRLNWIGSLFKSTYIEDPLIFTYDEQALKDAVYNLDMNNPRYYRAPSDAYIDKDEDGNYVVVPEDDGNQPYPDKIYEAVKAAVDAEQSEVFIDTESAYHKANVTSSDSEMNDFVKLASTINSEEITIDLVEATETLDTMQLLDMTYVDEDGEIFVDEGMLFEYVRGLSNKYDTFKQAQPFITHDGRKIEVGGNEEDGHGYAQDTYGFFLDEDATFSDLKAAIESGESQMVEATWEIPALARNRKNGCIGDSYIEISIDDQHLWAFWDGELILETDLVTGLEADPDKWSPTGLFRIFDRSAPATLTGEMAGESWESHVDFWMGITWTAVGLHNAPWRSAFGGDIYTYNGSHGCINMDYESAEFLYNTYGFDYPVVIY